MSGGTISICLQEKEVKLTRSRIDVGYGGGDHCRSRWNRRHRVVNGNFGRSQGSETGIS